MVLGVREGRDLEREEAGQGGVGTSRRVGRGGAEADETQDLEASAGGKRHVVMYVAT